jgi:hypothetical protein
MVSRQSWMVVAESFIKHRFISTEDLLDDCLTVDVPRMVTTWNHCSPWHAKPLRGTCDTVVKASISFADSVAYDSFVTAAISLGRSDSPHINHGSHLSSASTSTSSSQHTSHTMIPFRALNLLAGIRTRRSYSVVTFCCRKPGY